MTASPQAVTSCIVRCLPCWPSLTDLIKGTWLSGSSLWADQEQIRALGPSFRPSKNGDSSLTFSSQEHEQRAQSYSRKAVGKTEERPEGGPQHLSHEALGRGSHDQGFWGSFLEHQSLLELLLNYKRYCHVLKNSSLCETWNLSLYAESISFNQNCSQVNAK